MSREKQGFDENLIRIREVFPGLEALRIGQCAAFLGIDRHTARRKIRINEQTKMVTVVNFARQISV